MKDWIKPIEKMQACSEALEWAEAFDTFGDAWQACKYGDWMLWLLDKLSGEPESDSRKKLVLAVCECVRLVSHYVKKGGMSSLRAIETTEKWARGEDGITLDEVRVAAHAAQDEIRVRAYTTHTAYVASAVYAAHVAYATPTVYAAHAVSAAAYVVSAAARKKILKRCADIVRKYYPVGCQELSKWNI